MQIRGREVDFKISRLKDVGNMDLALKHMGKTEEELKKTEKVAVYFEKYLNMFRDFFRETTGVDVLDGCDDVLEAKETYYEFLEEVKKQKDAVLAPFSTEQIK